MVYRSFLSVWLHKFHLGFMGGSSKNLQRRHRAGETTNVFNSKYNKVELEGRSYLVTGANSGLGFCSAKWLASKGATVHMVCRNRERGEEAKSKIENDTGSKAVFLHLCDLSEPEEIRAFATEFMTEHRLDVLVRSFCIFFLLDR
jgi:hypothetical protein